MGHARRTKIDSQKPNLWGMRRPQLEALLADGPQQVQPRAGVGLDPPAQQSLDPEPDAPAAPPPLRATGGGGCEAPQQQNGADMPPAHSGKDAAALMVYVCRTCCLRMGVFIIVARRAAVAVAAGRAGGSSLTGVLTDGAAAGSQEFARRQRLLALLGWHAVPVPFGAAPAAEGGSGATSIEPGSSFPAQQASEVQNIIN